MADHAHAHSSEEFRKHIRTYWFVFGALLVLTVVTVGVSRLDLSPAMAVVVALAVAMVKGSLVALFFMHLIDEKKLIYATLTLTAFFFGVCMLVPLMTDRDSVGETHRAPPAAAHGSAHGGGH